MNFDEPQNLAWIILLLPLFSAGIITLFTQRSGVVSAQISIAAIALAFVATLGLLALLQEPLRITNHADAASYEWINLGPDLKFEIGLRLDRLSLLMLVVVTGVGLMIHIYSAGYMREDRSRARYFASLSLFTFSMLGIVLANNFVMMFIFWELVGVSSYLLIGFWYEKPSAAEACKKAFLTNRLGDFGFLLGILMVWGIFGSVNFDDLTTRLGRDLAEYSETGFANANARATERTTKESRLKRIGPITVRVVGMEEAQALNRDYRHKDHATNVLTFDYAQQPTVLADLVLCAEVVAREAAEQGKTLQAHYAHLLVHGSLHAQGWDHETSRAAALAMEAREVEILAGLGFRNPYA